MLQAHTRPSANDCFGDACGQRRLGGAGPAGVPLVVLHGFGGASGVLRSCRRSADPISTINVASGGHVAASIVMLLPEILKHAPFATNVRRNFLVKKYF